MSGVNYFSRDGLLMWYSYHKNYDVLNKVLDIRTYFFFHKENTGNLIQLT